VIFQKNGIITYLKIDLSKIEFIKSKKNDSFWHSSKVVDNYCCLGNERSDLPILRYRNKAKSTPAITLISGNHFDNERNNCQPFFLFEKNKGGPFFR
jgi:hypothetical protein